MVLKPRTAFLKSICFYRYQYYTIVIIMAEIAIMANIAIIAIMAIISPMNIILLDIIVNLLFMWLDLLLNW